MGVLIGPRKVLSYHDGRGTQNVNSSQRSLGYITPPGKRAYRTNEFRMSGYPTSGLGLSQAWKSGEKSEGKWKDWQRPALETAQRCANCG